MAVNQRLKLVIGQCSLVHDDGQQRDRAVKVEQVHCQTPGTLADLGVFTQIQQAGPVVQGLVQLAPPLCEKAQLLKHVRVVRMLDQQLPATLPGTGQVAQRQAQAEVFAQSLGVVRLQGAPSLKKLHGQLGTRVRQRNIGALLQPGGIDGWPLQRVEFIGEDLYRLLAASARQQAVEGLPRVLTTVPGVLAALPELHIDVGGTLRLFPGQVPLRRGIKRRPALLRIAAGQLFIGLRGNRRCLQAQRQPGQALQLRQGQ
ncbi:hypothetical protein D3C80_1224040 [compost metagenome]